MIFDTQYLIHMFFGRMTHQFDVVLQPITVGVQRNIQVIGISWGSVRDNLEIYPPIEHLGVPHTCGFWVPISSFFRGTSWWNIILGGNGHINCQLTKLLAIDAGYKWYLLDMRMAMNSGAPVVSFSAQLLEAGANSSTKDWSRTDPIDHLQLIEKDQDTCLKTYL